MAKHSRQFTQQRFLALFGALLCFTSPTSQAQQIRILQQGRDISLRGLSVLDNQTAWVSGDHGWVGHSRDGGKQWKWQQIQGHKETDFRSIYVLSEKKILLMCAGSPLLILLSEDGGIQWKTVHSDQRPDIFFDGMDFWNDREGIAFGDPLDGRMQILFTQDGGRSWRDRSAGTVNLLKTGEAGFAASGTGIRTLPGGSVLIGTGGSQAQLLVSSDKGVHWKAFPCPILHGQASMGIFSIAFTDPLNGIVVGGDYQHDLLNQNASFLTTDGGRTWKEPLTGIHGYRSCVEYLSRDTVIACGTSGVDLSTDGGLHWEKQADDSFHAVRKARNGSWTLLAGAKGCIGELFDKFH